MADTTSASASAPWVVGATAVLGGGEAIGTEEGVGVSGCKSTGEFALGVFVSRSGIGTCCDLVVVSIVSGSASGSSLVINFLLC